MNKLLLIAALSLGLSALSASASGAADTWHKTCAKCHGADGKGETKMGKKLEIKDFTDAKYQGSLTDEAMFKAIKQGVHDGERTRMKAYDDLSDSDIKALVAYVRGLKK